MENGTAAVEDSLAIPQKTSTYHYHIMQQFHPWVSTQRNESRAIKGYLQTHVHSSIIHNSQKVEANPVSVHQPMNG